MYDVIIIGAGVGGLSCASKLALSGKKVLILEKIHHIGGTSHIFKRGDFYFPMGPLSFSFPNFVKLMLKDIGIQEDIKFKRNHFQLITPELDIIYSQDWNKFKERLKKIFPQDREGIEKFFIEFKKLIKAISEIYTWHPEFLIGTKFKKGDKELIKKYKQDYDLIEKYAKISSKSILDYNLKTDSLKRLLGTQGSFEPIMNMVHLAFMWNIMSIEGIWFPSCGIHGINNLLKKCFLKHKGEIKLNTAVEQILIENNKAVGVKTSAGHIYRANWIVANADYKKIFLELIDPEKVPTLYLDTIRNTPYTGSDLSVYLGIDPLKVDLSKIKADHLFYRKKIQKIKKKIPEDFENKEIEICVWSNKLNNFAPKGMISLVIRVNMPYEYFKPWRIGEKKRKEGYIAFKYSLAEKLIETVEEILPGLKTSIMTMEVATPLTYQDWGQRFNGSVAGWSRDIRKIRIRKKVLSETPIENLFTVGIYSVLEPFLGGYPVSIYTGCSVADLILNKKLKKN
ncbi:MAG: phytoene desaturase family protein [Promethearchaeota archaeon]